MRYVDESVVYAEGGQPRKAPPLSVCKRCSRSNVIPVMWKSILEGTRLDLYCPDCQYTRSVIANKEHSDAFDDYLNDSTYNLVQALKQFARQRLEEDFEDIIYAIQHNHLQPEDF